MTLLGTVVLVAVNLMGLGIAYGRLRQGQMDAKEETHRRFDRIEKAIGINNGDGGLFVPRRECYLMEQSVKGELEGIKRRLTEIERILLGPRAGNE